MILKLDESLLNEDKDEELVESTEIESKLIEMINAEWDTIKEYNDFIEMLRNSNHSDMIEVINDINSEENTHVGQLQECLKVLSPDTYDIAEGEDEANDQLDDSSEKDMDDFEEESLTLELKDNESLEEDTVQKSNGKWTNRGDDGTEHGEFDTKAEADAQRKAMFASGYKGESLEDKSLSEMGAVNKARKIPEHNDYNPTIPLDVFRTMMKSKNPEVIKGALSAVEDDISADLSNGNLDEDSTVEYYSKYSKVKGAELLKDFLNRVGDK